MAQQLDVIEDHGDKFKESAGLDKYSAKETKRICLVVAIGLSGRGKSTALNNILGCNFPTSCGPMSCTTEVQHYLITERKYTIIVVDTPGFGAKDLSKPEVEQTITDVVGKLPQVLVYCYPVGGRIVDNPEENKMVKFLHETLGHDIWERTILLLTYSDELRLKCQTPDEYKEYLGTYIANFQTILKECCGSHVPDVKAVFDPNLGPGDLVAIPVGEKPDEAGYLVPGKKKTWNKIAYEEIMKKKRLIEKIDNLARSDSLMSLAYNPDLSNGKLAGMVVGGIIGVVFGFAGAIPGVAIGGMVGMAVEAKMISSKFVEMDNKLNHLMTERQDCLPHPDDGPRSLKRTAMKAQASPKPHSKKAHPKPAADLRKKSSSFHRSHRDTQQAIADHSKDSKLGLNRAYLDSEQPSDEHDQYVQYMREKPLQQDDVSKTPLDEFCSQPAFVKPASRSYVPKEEPDSN